MNRGIASTSETAQRRARAARGVFAGLALALALVSSGCTALTAPASLVAAPVHGIKEQMHYYDEADELITGWRNLVWSQASWKKHRQQFEAHPYEHDLGDGFRAGYRNVAAGGNGCPPPVAPRKYWSWKYQTPEGQAKVAAWFEGFPHGARAAEEEGIGNWSQIQVSYAIKQEYCDRCIGGTPGPTLVPGPPPQPGVEFLPPQRPGVEFLPPQRPGELMMPDRGPVMPPPGQIPARGAAGFPLPRGPQAQFVSSPNAHP